MVACISQNAEAYISRPEHWRSKDFCMEK